MLVSSTIFIIIFSESLFMMEAEKPFQFAEMRLTEEYHRYMIEAMKVLFRDENYTKLTGEMLKAGAEFDQTATALVAAHPEIRTELDELKRVEMERIRHAATRNYEIQNNLTILDHLDHSNPHSFEVKDLHILLKKWNEDEEKLEIERHEKFKRYEMEKKFQEEQKLNELKGIEREKFLLNIEQRKRRKLRRQAVRHPGSRKQLEYVWRNKDRIDDVFEPKTFFYMHDLDNNKVLDENEIKLIILVQLEGYDKNENAEKHEELRRMTKEVFDRADHNKDRLIDYKEYLQQMVNNDHVDDWKVLTEEDIFTAEEYEAYKKGRLNATTASEKPKV